MSSPQVELTGFLADLSGRRERLLQLAGPEQTNAALFEELSELGEQLIVAEEELRVQQEELDDASRRLQHLAAERDVLLQSATEAYVLTDHRGVVVQTNRAADVLVGRPSIRMTPRPIASWFAVADRRQVRSAIARAVQGQERETLGRLEIRRSDGSSASVTARLAVVADPESGRPLLRWELREMADAAITRLRAAGDQDPAGEPASRVLAAELASVAEGLATCPTIEDLVSAIMNAAASVIPSAQQAAVSLVTHRQPAETLGSLGGAAPAFEQAQWELQEGPVVDVVATEERVRVDDILDDSRWPALRRRIAEPGVRSVLSLPMRVARERLATLTLYSDQAAAFDEDSEFTASVLSVHAALALARALAENNLRSAIKSRQEIGQAVGILVEREKLTASAAFDCLVQASQRNHVKVRDLARIVVETGQDPRDIRPT